MEAIRLMQKCIMVVGESMKESIIRWQPDNETDEINTVEDLRDQLKIDEDYAEFNYSTETFNSCPIKVQLVDVTGKIVKGDIYLVLGWTEENNYFELTGVITDVCY